MVGWYNECRSVIDSVVRTGQPHSVALPAGVDSVEVVQRLRAEAPYCKIRVDRGKVKLSLKASPPPERSAER